MKRDRPLSKQGKRRLVNVACSSLLREMAPRDHAGVQNQYATSRRGAARSGRAETTRRSRCVTERRRRSIADRPTDDKRRALIADDDAT